MPSSAGANEGGQGGCEDDNLLLPKVPPNASKLRSSPMTIDFMDGKNSDNKRSKARLDDENCSGSHGSSSRLPQSKFSVRPTVTSQMSFSSLSKTPTSSRNSSSMGGPASSLRRNSPILKQCFISLVQLSTKLMDVNWDQTILHSCVTAGDEDGGGASGSNTACLQR